MPQYEIVLQGTLNNEALLTVLHYDVVSGVISDWNDVSGIIRQHMVDHLQERLVPNCVYTGIYVREDIPGGVGVEYPFSGGDVVGTNADGDNANQLALQITKLTNNGLKPARGRVYQGGLSSGGTGSDGLWQSNVRDDVQEFYEDIRFITVFGDAELQMVIKARNPSAPNTVPYNVVSSIGGKRIPTTQRRRKIGTGV